MNERLLLIDTCGEAAGLALCVGERVVARREMVPRSASAEMMVALGELLMESGMGLAEMDAVGVVSGPGSFTGVRVGMAAAKGLCEATGVRLAAVSRLAVLAEAAGTEIAVLDAGRGEVHVLDRSLTDGGREWVGSVEDVTGVAAGRSVGVAEKRIAERLAVGVDVILRPLQVEDALGLVLRRLAEGGDDVALVEARYGRGEDDIYSRATAPAVRPPAC